VKRARRTKPVREPTPHGAAAAPRAPERAPGISAAERWRLGILVGVLLLAAGGYLGTARWRTHLLEESARSRRVVAAVEGAAQEREQRRTHAEQLEATLRSRPEDVEARIELARLRWDDAGPQAAVTVLQGAGPALTDVRALRMLAGA
jgi:cytochrome c-type biogenesis protein CcmH/NrfG